MKKLLFSIKPFLIFQIILFLITWFLRLINPESDIWIIIGYGFMVPYYGGGIYILGALFGIWIQHRSNNNFRMLLYSSISSVILIIPPIFLQFYNYLYDYKTIVTFVLFEILSLVCGQLIGFIYYVLKKRCK